MLGPISVPIYPGWAALFMGCPIYPVWAALCSALYRDAVFSQCGILLTSVCSLQGHGPDVVEGGGPCQFSRAFEGLLENRAQN